MKVRSLLMKLNLNRFKNYGLWVSIIALIPLILSGFGITVVPSNYTAITNAVLGIGIYGL